MSDAGAISRCAGLKSFNFFEGMDDAHLLLAAEKMSEVAFAGGATLFEEGAQSDAVYFLLSGRCRAWRGGIAIGAIHPGEPIGEVGYLARSPRTASVIAERDCWCLKLGFDDLSAIIADAPNFGLHMAQTLAARLANVAERQARARNRSTAFLFSADISAGLRGACEDRLRAALARHGDVVFVSAETLRQQFGRAGLDMPFGHEVDFWLSEIERTSAHLVYLAGEGDPERWVDKCERQTDRCYLVHRHASDAGLGEREAMMIGARHGRHLGLVLLHDPKPSEIRDTRRWAQGRNPSKILHVDVALDEDWRRVARYVFDSAIGLVLGGGGALYTLHIGVMKALLEAGFAFDAVGGSSAGACAALGYVAGQSLDEFAERSRRLFQDQRALSRPAVPVYGLLDPTIFDRGLREACGGRHIEDMQIPFFATAMNLSQGRYDILTQGLMWEALRASASIPGVLPPFTINGDLMSDGGAYDALPVLPMRERLSGPIIAVNLPEADMMARPRHDYAARPHWALRLARRGRGGGPHYPMLIEALMHTFRFSGNARLAESMAAADLVIAPNPPAGAHMLNWSLHHEQIEAGYRHTLDMLEKCEKEGHPGLARLRKALI